MTPITFRDLDAFVQQTDQLGGPGSAACDAYWGTITYEVGVAVDETLDPFSDAYVDQQLAVYAELSGRAFDQVANEHSDIDVSTHIVAVNPYNHPSPGGLAVHLQRLSQALQRASPALGSKMLDMGCGWGLSSEIAAYCGLNVTAVDINPDFVRLVETRARRLNLRISAQQGTFDGFSSPEKFDTVLFYECLHHALRPWTVLSRMAQMLSFDGRVVLAGEPINSIWWKHWGLRLDPLSIYCIRKFGWFESGWSADFLKAAIEHAGLSCSLWEAPDTGYTVIGNFASQKTLPAVEIARMATMTGWMNDVDYLTSTGVSTLALELHEDARKVRLDLTVFRPAPLRTVVTANSLEVFNGELSPGQTVLNVDTNGAASLTLEITTDIWCPNTEIGNDDNRKIGIHLRAIGII